MSVTGYVVLAAIIIAVILLFTVGVAWVFAWFFCKPHRSMPEKTPADYGLKYEPIKLSSHGKKLNGWFIPAKDTTRPAPGIVIVHSWGGNMGKMLPVAQKLHDKGAAVLLYHARGHGDSDSDGPITLLKYTQDIRTAVDCLVSRKDIDSTKIGVVGHSMGAAATIVGTSLDGRIKAAVGSSAFSDPTELTKQYLRKMHLPIWPYLRLSTGFFQRWLRMPMDRVSPVKHISQVKVPVLLFHGAGDTSISPDNFKILLKNAPGELVEGVLLPGCNHSGIYNEAAYTARMIPFMEKNLLARE
jgi:uncharacterized protein